MIQVLANPFGAADFHGFANCICEGTEQIQNGIEFAYFYICVLQSSPGTCYPGTVLYIQ